MAKARAKPADFPNPVRGVYESAPWHEGAIRHTPAASNVLPYDSLNRNRPGKRPGTQKYFTYQFGGGARFCQHLSWANVQDTTAGTSKTVIIACFGGMAYVQTPGGAINRVDGGGAAPFSTGRKVSAVTLNNITFLTDGLANFKYTHTTSTWASWAATAGSFPVAGSEYPRILAVWRGRVVLARLDKGVASTIFFTAQGSGTDFDYGAAPATAATAVATDSNFRAGQLGEGVTALIPFNNDRLIVGCENSIHEFQGDPADGGTLVPVSYGVGILSDTAWCQVNGAVYFIGTGGLYRMRPGTEPECLSQFAVDAAFRDIPHQGNYLSLAYDKRRHGVWVFVSQVAAPFRTRHYFYDLRGEEMFGRGGFWPTAFPADTGGDDGASGTTAPTYGPSKCLSFDGDEQTSDGRCVILGCRDGHIRTFDDDVLDDDGTAIPWSIHLGPLQPAGPTGTAMLNGWAPVMGEASNFKASWELRVGADPYAASVAVAAKSGTFPTGGRQSPRGERMAANSFWFYFSDDTAGKTASIERVTGTFEAAGPNR